MAKFCPECANPIIDGNMQFCTKCGAKLPITSLIVQPPVTQPVAVQQPAHPSWYIPPVNSASTSVQAPTQQPQGSTTKSIPKKRSANEWICYGGVILLVILTALFYGYYQSSNYFQRSNTGNSFSTPVTGSKTSDLKIGETAILSSDGDSIVVKVINFTHPEKLGDGSPASKNFYIFGIEVKNIGQKAIIGNSVRSWVTDWAGVSYGDLGYRISIGESYLSPPFYPGDTITEIGAEEFSDKSMQGKLTFHYAFYDQTASWIIKE